MLPLLATADRGWPEHLRRLWYPIIVALMTFVIGLLFVRETRM